MTNPLTGGFDAVVLVRIQVLNGILAALHRNGGAAQRTPSLLHGFVLPLGPLPFTSELQRTLGWARAFRPAGDVMQASGKTLAAVAPPGVLRAVEEADNELQAVQDGGLTLHAVRGLGEVQVSSPSLTLPPGSSSAITTRFQLRARFLPSAGSAPLPAPIHGVGQAGFHVQLSPGTAGKLLVAVTPSADDGAFGFTPAPGTGLDGADAAKIAFQIRQALRTRFEPVAFELDGDLPFTGFKALGSGADQTLALPVMLGGGAAPGLGGVQQSFLDTSDHFAIAIAREFLDVRLQPLLDGIRGIGFQFEVKSLGITWATYTVSVSSATLAWKSGELELSVHGNAVTGSLFPNYAFGVKQRLTLVLDPATQGITLVAVGDPVISGLPGFALGTARTSIVQARDAALAAAQPQIRQALAQASLDKATSALDGAPRSTLTAVDVETQGVVLHGRVQDTGPSEPLLEIEEIAGGGAFSAHASWMPGGWIERYLWSWKEGGFAQNPWGGVVHTALREHEFVLPKPASAPNVASICLKVMGTQVKPTGAVVAVEGGEVCRIRQPGWLVATMPSWWDLLLPIWEIDPSPEERLEDTVAAHVNALAHARSRAVLGANTLVHFADAAQRAPLDALDAALDGLRGGDLPLALCLVLPRGTLADRRVAVERRIGALGRERRVWLAVTEDYEGHWARAFAHEKGPATYAMNARGEFVWRHAGPPEARSFAPLERHLIPGRPLRHRALRLALRNGERAPDLSFPLGGGRSLALRRLRGRRVLLCFWKSWSRPCLEELRRLQRLCDGSGPHGPLVLAIHGGEDARALERVAHEERLTLTLVPDPGRAIARRYGVACWPTTVSLDEHGNVAGVHFGLGREALAPAAGADAAGA